MEFLVKGIEDTNVKAYYDFMVNAAVIFGANRSVAEQELLDSLKFEIELAKVKKLKCCFICICQSIRFITFFQIAVPEGERRNLSALYNPFVIRDLQAKYPYLSWLQYINGLLSGAFHVEENEIVIIDVPNYFDRLNSILIATPTRTIANYFAWRSVLFTSDWMNEKLRQLKLAFYATTIGLRKNDNRFIECVTLTTK